MKENLGMGKCPDRYFITIDSDEVLSPSALPKVQYAAG
jgi:hypothetical protein